MTWQRCLCLSALDVLTLAVVGGLVSAGTICAGHLTWTSVLLLVLGSGIVVLARLAERTRRAQVIHDFYPVISVPVVFNTLGPVIDCINPHRWDDFFGRVDNMFLYELATAWRAACGRPWWLTDAASLSYVSYYAFPVVLAVVEYRKPNRPEFSRFAFRVVTCFYLSYLGYCCFPTVGPRVPHELQDDVVGGSWLSRVVRAFFYYAEHTLTDAFPSGHTAVTLVCLFHGWRRLPQYRVLWVAWSGGIIFSTVYLYYHYVVDIVAGAVLGAVAPFVADAIRHRLEFFQHRVEVGTAS